MSRRDSAGAYFSLSIAVFAMMGVIILLMSVPAFYKSNVAVIVIGLCFWGCLLTGLLFAGLAAKTVRDRMKKLGRQREWERKGIGLLSFGISLPGLISDIVFAVCFLLVIVFRFTPLRNAFVNYILISLGLLSFNYHGLFNGRTFYFLNTKTEDTRRRDRNEKN